MKNAAFSVVCALILLFAFSSCASEKPATFVSESPQAEPIPPKRAEAGEPTPQKPPEEPVVEVQPVTEEPVIEVQPPAEDPAAEETLPPEEPQATKETFEVTKEVYNQAFDEISKLIDELNTIIRNNEFDKWQRHLTDDYKKKYSNSRILNELSQQPILKKYNVTLKTLRDYFMYVVVQSRSNAKLDDLEFIDDSHVNALMAINQRKVILYQIQKTPEGWKIGEW